jgi:integrase
VHAVHVTVSKALKDAVRWGKLTRNVAALADPPQPNDDEAAVWSPEQLRMFLAYVVEDRLSAMWLTFITTGMRRGEVAGLRWEWLDFDKSEVHIRKTRVVVDYQVDDSEPKTARSKRTVSLDPITTGALKAHRKRQLEERLAWGPTWTDTGLVFTREDGIGYHPERLTQMFQRHAKGAGLPVIPLHGARHSYATAALEAGEDIKIVSALLGHSSIGITGDLYQHVQDRLRQQSANRTASYILQPDQ